MFVYPLVFSNRMLSYFYNYRLLILVASWLSGRHLALRSGALGFESWSCPVDVESLGKALYMHFFTPPMCKDSFPVMLPRELRKVQWSERPVRTLYKALTALFVDNRYINFLSNLIVSNIFDPLKYTFRLVKIVS